MQTSAYSWAHGDPRLRDVSFPDELVSNVRLDRANSNICFLVSGVFIDGTPEPRIHMESQVMISAWDSVQMRVYLHETHAWRASEDIEGDFPSEVLEWEPSKTGLALRGFGKKSGSWVEIVVKGEATRIELTSPPK
jgi:hypothetical protein